jgi:hypothetical protein
MAGGLSKEAALRALQRNKTIKRQPNRVPGVPDFFKTKDFGMLLNDHDYMARWVAATTPGFWGTWMRTCEAVISDPERIVNAVSGHDVAYEFRRKVKLQPRIQGQDYKIASAQTAYLMRLAVRCRQEWRESVVVDRIRRELFEVNVWIVNGDIPLPA